MTDDDIRDEQIEMIVRAIYALAENFDVEPETVAEAAVKAAATILIGKAGASLENAADLLEELGAALRTLPAQEQPDNPTPLVN